MAGILIVDNKLQNLYKLKKLLRSFNYKVILAGNGKNALNLANKEPPDLIITETSMPSMDGFKLCQEFKKDKKLAKIPLIFYTSDKYSKRNEQLALNLGAEGFITRLQKPGTLKKTISMILKKHQKKKNSSSKSNEKKSKNPNYSKKGKATELERKVEKLQTEIRKLKKIDKELKFKNAILNTQMETSIDGILAVDENNKIVSYNNRFLDIWGIPDKVMDFKSDIIAIKSVLDKVTDPDQFLKKIKHLYKHREESSIDEILLNDGRIFERYSAPMMGDNENYLGRLWYFRDITDKKQTKEALEKRIVALTQPLDTTDGITFEDLFNLSDIQHLQDSFADAFGVAALITQPDGTPITKPSNFSYLCKEIIRKNAKGVINCNISDAKIGKPNPSGPTIKPCMSAGLCNAGASIIVGGHHIANWLIGQVRNKGLNEKKIMKYARIIGVDEKDFCEAYQKIPIMSQEQFDKAANVLFTIVTQLSTFAYQNIQQARFISERKMAEDALRESEKRLREIIDFLPDATLIIDRNGIVIAWNKAHEEITGIKAESILGKGNYEYSLAFYEYRRPILIDLVSKSDEELEKKYSYIKKDGNALTAENKMRFRGRDIYLWSKAVPLYDSKGNIIGAIETTRDITEQKKAEEALRESEEKYRTLVDNMQDVVYRSDMNGNITFTTPSAARMLGCPSAESMIGMNIAKELYFHPEDREEFLNELKKQGKLTHYEITLKRKDNGNPVIISTNSQFYYDKDGKIIGIEGVFRNISKQKNAEEKIKQLANLQQTILDTLTVGLIYIKERRTQWTNSAWANMFGYENLEIIGKETLIFYNDIENYKKVGSEGYSILSKGGIYSTEIKGKRKDGSTFLCNLVGKAINPEDISEGSIWLVQDITERKKSEEELNKYRIHLEELVEERTQNLDKERILLRTLIDSVPDEIYIKDNDCRLILANKNVIKSFGMKEIKEILGKSDFDILPHKIAKKNYTDEINILSTGESLINKEEMVIYSNGKKSWKSVTKVPLRDNNDKIIGLVGINRDITNIKIIEENLQKSKEEAESANQAKTIFLSNMSHEIRTPMNVILGFSQLMLRDASITSQQKERLNNINQSGEHLLALINDILEISKIEAGHLTINSTKFNLHEFLNNIESMFKIKTDAKQLIFKINSIEKLPKFIISDEAKLRQIFMNLISNAVKFTDKGEISVNVCIKKINNDLFLKADVKDTGQGIAKKDMKKIFNLFEQTEAGVKAGGTGLGLALSKKLVNILGGDISFKSAFNKGSCFTFNIKIQESHDEEVTDQVITKKRIIGIKPGQKKYKVLIADDVLENRIFLQDMLKNIGFNVLEADNGKDAIKKFKDWLPDVILMDINMPQLNGFEAIEIIKKMKSGKNIPIIVITSYILNMEKEKIMKIGAKECLSKPFKEQALFDALKSCLDIEYIYELDENYSSALIKEKIMDVLSNLPEELVNKMLEAIESLELRRLLDLINEVEKISIETADFLRTAAKKYQYDMLMKLFLKLKGNNE